MPNGCGVISVTCHATRHRGVMARPSTTSSRNSSPGVPQRCGRCTPRGTDHRRCDGPTSRSRKHELRPLGVPCIGDRVLQRSVADVLTAIYEQDFLPCSFGGRPGVGAHHALATLHEVIAGKPVSWIYEADLRNFFGSLDHAWLLRFVHHRVGDPRILRLIRRWLKAGVLEDGSIEPSEEGVPQGGSVSVVLSNLYLHYVLD